jgi:hypothetical protein
LISDSLANQLGKNILLATVAYSVMGELPLAHVPKPVEIVGFVLV